jgi:hypothetical protein
MSIRTVLKAVRPIGVLLAVVLLLTGVYCQSTRAAMIGTEQFLESNRCQQTRNQLLRLLDHQKIRKALMAQGVTPQEAQSRINSLTDSEIELLAQKISHLPAGGGVGTFAAIIAIVVLIVIIMVEYNSPVKMFPQFQFQGS